MNPVPSLSPDESERYARHLSLPDFGVEGQLKLKQSHAGVIGLGGLGSPVALYLCAAGVGKLTLIDPDTVSLTNLQRQILHTNDGVGMPKTDSARARLNNLNPLVQISTVSERLTVENVTRILTGCDVVIDASDNYATRFISADAARTLHLPWVYGAVKAFQGQVAVFAPHEGTACYRCLFPEHTPMQGEDTASAFGLLGAHAGMVGCLQALETLKLLAGLHSPLRGAMLAIDTRSMRFTRIPLAKNTACPCCR